MNMKTIAGFAVIAGLAMSATAQAQEPVAAKTDGMAPHVATKVKEKAAKGTDALRQYIFATRMIHALHFADVVRK